MGLYQRDVEGREEQGGRLQLRRPEENLSRAGAHSLPTDRSCALVSADRGADLSGGPEWFAQRVWNSTIPVAKEFL